MRQPGRMRISWQDDATLKLEFDAGTQTRLLQLRSRDTAAGGEDAGRASRSRSGKARASAAAASAATPTARDRRRDPVARRARRRWPGAARWSAAAPAAQINRGGDLKVVTTNFREGYLRKNGVPYSEQATITEYFHRLPTHPNGDVWLQVLTIVEDPQVPERAVLHEHELPTGTRRLQVRAVALQDRPAAAGEDG